MDTDAVSAARRGWRGDPAGNGCGYTKAGVILDDLLPKADRPAMLFQPDRPRDARLTDALDAINSLIPQKSRHQNGQKSRFCKRSVVPDAVSWALEELDPPSGLQVILS